MVNKIVSGGVESIKIWDLKTGNLLREVCAGIEGVWGVAVDDKTLVASVKRGDGTTLEVCRSSPQH